MMKVVYYIDAPGGTGKTFLLNLILAKVRAQGNIALAVASSGIATTLLSGGRTAHSTFKLPINLNHIEYPACNISKNTGTAKLFKKSKIIVWDESTMSHKNALEALDRTLQDLRGNRNLMGNMVVLLACDFRQTLPIIARGTMADELQACLKNSYIWPAVRKFKLTTNMRVYLSGANPTDKYADQLLNLGKGKFANDRSVIGFPENFCNMVEDLIGLEEKVFPNIKSNFENYQWLTERAILAPKNECVNIINTRILQKLPGAVKSYVSIDTVVDINNAVHYPTEFLNSLEPPGMPPHNLTLKIGSSIMLLRNLDAPKLCNGTRLMVKTLLPNVIEAVILTGCAKGEDVFIPKIPLIPTDLPFEFKRLQFPLKLAFAMSINKSQGQSFKVVGLNLLDPCFSHGQLYVGCSRVGNRRTIYLNT